MSLRDGALSIGNGQKVSYVVEHDKIGRYVLPTGYVGASSGSLIFNRNGNPSKLRLDGEPRPTRVEVTNDASGEVIAFDRSDGS